MYDKVVKSFLNKANLLSIDLKAVLFDMDGVLFDSMPLHVIAWTKTLHEMGLYFTEEEAYLHEGRTGSGTINIVYQREFGRDATQEEVELIYNKKSVLFDSLPEASVMPGSLELLNHIKEGGFQRILVTGSGQKALLSKMNLLFPGHFTRTKMVTAYDVKKGKPDPEPYLQGLHKAGVNANQAIVVENAPLGIESAKSAGIFTVAVNTGLLSDHYLTDAGADILFESMPALFEAWPKLLQSIRTIRKD